MLGPLCDIIVELDPAIRQTDNMSAAEQVIVVYGYYDNSIRIGGHFAAAIRQSDGDFRIYNGIGSGGGNVDLFDYINWIQSTYYNGNSGCVIDGVVLFY